MGETGGTGTYLGHGLEESTGDRLFVWEGYFGDEERY